jgi:hypothetical protein
VADGNSDDDDDDDDDDFIYPDPSPQRWYAGYLNYIYPCPYM